MSHEFPRTLAPVLAPANGAPTAPPTSETQSSTEIAQAAPASMCAPGMRVSGRAEFGVVQRGVP